MHPRSLIHAMAVTLNRPHREPVLLLDRIDEDVGRGSIAVWALRGATRA